MVWRLIRLQIMPRMSLVLPSTMSVCATQRGASSAPRLSLSLSLSRMCVFKKKGKGQTLCANVGQLEPGPLDRVQRAPDVLHLLQPVRRRRVVPEQLGRLVLWICENLLCVCARPIQGESHVWVRWVQRGRTMSWTSLMPSRKSEPRCVSGLRPLGSSRALSLGVHAWPSALSGSIKRAEQRRKDGPLAIDLVLDILVLCIRTEAHRLRRRACSLHRDRVCPSMLSMAVSVLLRMGERAEPRGEGRRR